MLVTPCTFFKSNELFNVYLFKCSAVHFKPEISLLYIQDICTCTMSYYICFRNNLMVKRRPLSFPSSPKHLNKPSNHTGCYLASEQTTINFYLCLLKVNVEYHVFFQPLHSNVTKNQLVLLNNPLKVRYPLQTQLQSDNCLSQNLRPLYRSQKT